MFLKQIPASIEEVVDGGGSSTKTKESVVSGSHKRKTKEKTSKGAKYKQKVREKDESVIQQKTVVEIVTGKGLSVPMCDGEEVVCLHWFHETK